MTAAAAVTAPRVLIESFKLQRWFRIRKTKAQSEERWHKQRKDDQVAGMYHLTGLEFRSGVQGATR